MKRARGFTLIELAIVLVIITILIGGLAVPLSAQIQARRIAETKQTLDEVRDALVGYAMTHKTAGGHPYLPCPDTSGNGEESRNPLSGSCLGQGGFLPWVTLGVGNMDAWGNRLHYRTINNVSNGVNSLVGNAMPAGSGLQICSSASACSTTSGDIASDVPAVVVSFGPNGKGARNALDGAYRVAATGIHEQENQDTDTIYVSRPPYKPANGSPAEEAKEYDDLTAWIPYPVLVARVCPTGCP